MQICHVNTLGNVADPLQKISMEDIQNGDQEIVLMKHHFLTTGEKVRVFFKSAYFCTLVVILVFYWTPLIQKTIFERYGALMTFYLIFISKYQIKSSF